MAIVKRKRLDNRAAKREQQIIAAALFLADKKGLQYVTCAGIAREIKSTHALVCYYFNTASNLVDHIVKLAIKDKRLLIIAEALALRHPAVKKISLALKTQAVKTLLK